jgi:hypothetical protein
MWVGGVLASLCGGVLGPLVRRGGAMKAELCPPQKRVCAGGGDVCVCAARMGTNGVRLVFLSAGCGAVRGAVEPLLPPIP